MEGPLAQVRGFPVPDGPPLDLDVHPGNVVRVVGPNGSGKTSLLRALAGLDAWQAPDSVDAAPCGFAMQSAKDSLIGLTVQGEFGLRGRGVPTDLHGLVDRDVATLSAGEARRVAVTVATGHGPLLLLDEPSEGLDAGARRRLRDAILDARRSGAVVVADHGDHWADVADRTVNLGRSDDGMFPPFDAPSTDARIACAGGTHHVGDRTLPLPSFDLPAGFHALVGPNGVGKTQALLHLLSDHDGPLRMLPAQAKDVLHRPTVRADLADVDDGVRRALVPDGIMHRHPWGLSGGEQQRVALAKVLGVPSDVYLLDEPEAHLDAAGRRALHDVLADRIRDGACVLAATHDVGLIAAAATVVSMEAPA